MDKLRKLREDAGLSLAELGRLTGKSRGYISNVENGTYKLTQPETIHAWAEAIEVEPDEIYVIVGRIPADIEEALQRSDVETLQQVRKLLEA